MMAGNFSRQKGQRAEREAIKHLQPVVNKVYELRGLEVPVLERNLMQSHRGGYDIAGLEWLALEVKHHETLQVSSWWEQTKRQAGESRVPVLFYKQNRTKWSVYMFGYVPIEGDRRVRCPVEISLEVFLLYFEHKLIAELNK